MSQCPLNLCLVRMSTNMVKVNLVFQLLTILVSGSLAFHSRNVRLNPLYYGSKIVGGNVTDIKFHPYQVSLESSSSHICGGSIISSDYILTAAHCTNWQDPSVLQVRLGTSYKMASGKAYKVVKIIQHPQYVRSIVDYDYSILKLEAPIKFSEKAQPVLLPDDQEPEVVGADCIVSGWGLTNNPKESERKLRAVTVHIIDRDTCDNAYKEYYGITKRMLCAGNVEKGGKDSCQGDSGGPLVTRMKNGSMKLIGVVSWGKSCAEKGYPGVYSKVSTVRTWITEQTNV